MSKVDFTGIYAGSEAINHVATNSPLARNSDKFEDAALVKEHLDSVNPDFEHTVAVSDNGAIVATGRVSKAMREYLLALTRNT